MTTSSSSYHYGKIIGARIHKKSNALGDRQFIKELLDAYQRESTPVEAPATLTSGQDYGQYLKYQQAQHYEDDKGTSFLNGVNDGARGEDHVGSDIEDDEDTKGPIDISDDEGAEEREKNNIVPRSARYDKLPHRQRLFDKMSKRSPVKQRAFQLEDAAVSRHAHRGVTNNRSAVLYYQSLETLLRSALNSVRQQTNTRHLHRFFNYATVIQTSTPDKLAALWDPAIIHMQEYDNEKRYIDNIVFVGHGRELTLDSRVTSSALHVTAIRAAALVFPLTTLIIDTDEYTHALRNIVMYLCAVVPTLRNIRMIVAPEIDDDDDDEDDEDIEGETQEAREARRDARRGPMMARLHQDTSRFTTYLRHAVNMSSSIRNLSLKYIQNERFAFMADDYDFIAETLFTNMYAESTQPNYPYISALKVKYIHNNDEWAPFYRNLIKHPSVWHVESLRANFVIDELFNTGVLQQFSNLKVLRGRLLNLSSDFQKWFSASRLTFARFIDLDSDNATTIFDIEPRATHLTYLISHIPSTLRTLELVVDLDVGSNAIERPYLTNETQLERFSCVRKDSPTVEIFPVLAAERREQQRRVVAVAPSLLSTLINAITEGPTILSSRRLFPTSSSSSSSSSVFGDLLGEKLAGRPRSGPWRDWPPYSQS